MRLRVVCFGMLGEFSASPLQHLLTDELAHVCGVVMPMLAPTSEPVRLLPRLSVAPRQTLNVVPAARHPNIAQLAHAHHIPVYEVSDVRDTRTWETLRALQPDVLVVACFPFILPKRILTLPTYGCFNLHPSLLPKLRGPEPLFWVFHEGAHAGVTLHRMAARVDAGDIVAQTPLTLPDGIGYAEAERLCARTGAELLANAIHTLAAERTLHTQPQDERAASYAPLPTANDFVVTPAWSAQHAFNFMRGVSALGQPIIHVDDQRFVVQETLAYRSGETRRETHHAKGEPVWMRFADGIVQVRV